MSRDSADRASLGTTQRAALARERTTVHGGAPCMVWVDGALPPDQPLGSGGEVMGTGPSIFCRMPFTHELGMRDGNRVLPAMPGINPAMKATGTVRTVAPLAVVHRGVPHMMGVGRTLPPDPLARVKGDVLRGQAAIFGGMPGGGELGGFPAQRAGLKRLVIPGAPGQRAPPAAGALARPGFDRGAPDMLGILMTLPPNWLSTVGRALIEREEPVFRRMPLAGEVGASKAEGRRRACLHGPSGPSLWRRSCVHRGGAMRSAYLDNTVRRCIGSVNGLVGFAGATAQDVGRAEA